MRGGTSQGLGALVAATGVWCLVVFGVSCLVFGVWCLVGALRHRWWSLACWRSSEAAALRKWGGAGRRSGDSNSRVGRPGPPQAHQGRTSGASPHGLAATERPPATPGKKKKKADRDTGRGQRHTVHSSPCREESEPREAQRRTRRVSKAGGPPSVAWGL